MYPIRFLFTIITEDNCAVPCKKEHLRIQVIHIDILDVLGWYGCINIPPK